MSGCVQVECKIPDPFNLKATDCQNNMETIPPNADPTKTPQNGVCGFINRTWTTTEMDCAGNRGMFTLPYGIYKDPPIVDAPPDVPHVECGINETAPTGNITITDNCVVDDDEYHRAEYLDEMITGTDVCQGRVDKRTWVVTDSCWNEVHAEQLITTKDTTPPMFTFVPPDTTIECGSGDDTGEATAVDACTTVTISSIETLTGDACDRTKTIAWIAEDECGLTETENQIVTIRDRLPPVIFNVPADRSFKCRGSCFSMQNLDPVCTGGLPSLSDQCDATQAALSFDDTRTCLTTGAVFLRTFSAEDECGNIATEEEQRITVMDDCLFSVDTAYMGESLDVTVDMMNMDEGVQFTVAFTDANTVADMRGFFFEVLDLDPNNLPGIDSGSLMTNLTCNSGGVDVLGPDIDLQRTAGSNIPVFECAVEIGTAGIATDDIRSATFKITGQDINGRVFSTFNFPDPRSRVAIISNSVEMAGGTRNGQSKMFGPVTCCRVCELELPPTPTPTTMPPDAGSSEPPDSGSSSPPTLKPHAVRVSKKKKKVYKVRSRKRRRRPKTRRRRKSKKRRSKKRYYSSRSRKSKKNVFAYH